MTTVNEENSENIQTVEQVNVAGDILIEQLFLTTHTGELDLKNFFMQLELNEDIFSPVLTGHLMIGDAAGLIGTIPILGGEAITLHARTPTLPDNESFAFKRSFIITGISNRGFTTDREQYYILDFMSPEGVKDNNTKLSQVLIGTPDKVVGDLFEKHLGTSRYISTSVPNSPKTGLVLINAPYGPALKFIAPYWSPLKIMNWFATRSVSSSGKAPNMLLFESNKQFYFTSVEDLIQIQRNSKSLFNQYFWSDSAVRDPEAGGFSYVASDIGRQYSVIQDIRIDKYVDILKAQDYGFYASTLLTHDIVLKRYREFTWDYHANFNTYNHMEDYRVKGDTVVSESGNHQTFRSDTPRNPSGHRALHTKHFQMFNDIKDTLVEQWAVQRNSLLYELSNIRVNIQVPGRTDVEVGRLVYVHFPLGTDRRAEEETNYDPYMSGIYLITAIRHTITMNGKHNMTMELVKDSFRQPVN
jgi:hypothetical protein